MYGDGVLEKLSEMGNASKQLQSMVNRTSLAPFWGGVRYTPTCAVVPVRAFAEEPVFFWREAMKEVCHKMGTGKIGEKPLKILRDRLLNPKGKEGWVALKRDNKACHIILGACFGPNWRFNCTIHSTCYTSTYFSLGCRHFYGRTSSHYSEVHFFRWK